MIFVQVLGPTWQNFSIHIPSIELIIFGFEFTYSYFILIMNIQHQSFVLFCNSFDNSEENAKITFSFSFGQVGICYETNHSDI